MKHRGNIRIKNVFSMTFALGFVVMGLTVVGNLLTGAWGTSTLLGMSLPGVYANESILSPKVMVALAMPSFSGEYGSYSRFLSSGFTEYFYEGEPETPPAEQTPADYTEILESLAADETFAPVDETLAQYTREVQAINLHPSDSSGDERWSNVFMRNQSEQTYDPDSLMREKLNLSLKPAEEGPQVLIYHTHGSEAFNTTGDIYYTNQSMNTKDVSRNVVAVGEVLEQTLSALGVEAIHCDKLHDESYNDAYTNSRKSIEQYLEEYPTIKVVIDLHRDSMVSENEVKYRPVVEVDRMQVAQVMAVVGVGEPNDHWQDNLRFSIALCDRLEQKYPGITRPMLIRTSHYNAHLSNGATLLEVGTCGNTLTEAKRAGVLVGTALAELIHENGG